MLSSHLEQSRWTITRLRRLSRRASCTICEAPRSRYAEIQGPNHFNAQLNCPRRRRGRDVAANGADVERVGNHDAVGGDESRAAEFFKLTKRLHNLIHGHGDPALSSSDRQLYDDVSHSVADALRTHLKARRRAGRSRSAAFGRRPDAQKQIAHTRFLALSYRAGLCFASSPAPHGIF